jgi:hypothetical protein
MRFAVVSGLLLGLCLLLSLSVAEARSVSLLKPASVVSKAKARAAAKLNKLNKLSKLQGGSSSPVVTGAATATSNVAVTSDLGGKLSSGVAGAPDYVKLLIGAGGIYAGNL